MRVSLRDEASQPNGAIHIGIDVDAVISCVGRGAILTQLDL